MLKNKNKLKIFLAFLIIVLPMFNPFFSNNIDSIPKVNDQTLNFYQTNTCDVSLGKFMFFNYDNNSLEYQLQFKSDIPCYGKVFYIEPSEEKYIVLISLNPMVSILLQTITWLLLISVIKKNKVNFRKKSILEMFFLVLMLMAHLLSEKDFYIMKNLNYFNKIEFGNFFLISYFLIFSFIVYYVAEICLSRTENLIYYTPFIFLLQGTFIGTNLNIFVITLFVIGFKNFKNRNLGFFNTSYLLILFITLYKDYSVYSYFDIDKLRGFSMSSNSFTAVLFWSLNILFIINGVLYLTSQNEDFNYKRLINNFQFSGFLLITIGILSSFNDVLNKIILLFFGLNKSSSATLSSVAGNSWRGISPSAEMIGEFYAITLLLSFLIVNTTSIRFKKVNYLYLFFIIYGLFRANNATAIALLLIFLIIFIIKQNIKNIEFRILIYILLASITLIISYFLLRQNTYSNMSHILPIEALDITGVNEKLIKEKDFKTIFNNENSQNLSSSLKFTSKYLIDDNNIPFLPNVFAIFSTFALFINRSEKWGIFFAKYDPNLLDFTFGYGGLNLINYEFDNSIDTPGLVLPHSSILSILIFFGILGLLIFLYLTLNNLYKNKNNVVMSFPVFFLLINFIKSDSLFYLPMFIMFLTLFSLLDKKSTTQ